MLVFVKINDSRRIVDSVAIGPPGCIYNDFHRDFAIIPQCLYIVASAD